jgi:hypothetical protein
VRPAKFSPRRGFRQIRGVLEKQQSGSQNGPDAQQVDGNIDRLKKMKKMVKNFKVFRLGRASTLTNDSKTYIGMVK